MAPLVSLLLSAGPALLRIFGEAKGGSMGTIAAKTADLVEAVQGKPNAPVILQQHLNQLSPEERQQLGVLQVELAKVEAEREQNRFQHDLGMHSEQQATIREGDSASGEYVRETRPMMARYSGISGSIYVCGLELLSAFDKGAGADWQLAAMLFSPLLAYMGFRTWDAFSQFKGPKL